MEPAFKSGRRRGQANHPVDRFIPWLFVAFFLVVFAANGVLIAIAVDSFTGLSTEHAYKKGIAYNQTIAEAEAQAKLGWEFDIDAAELKRGGGLVAVRARNADDGALTGAHLEAHFIRPTSAGVDTRAAFTETAAGVYEAEPGLPLAGVWDMMVIADHDGARYQTTRRILVPE